jgi:hypothetical protein
MCAATFDSFSEVREEQDLKVQNQLGTEYFSGTRSHTTKKTRKNTEFKAGLRRRDFIEAYISWRSATGCTQNVSLELMKVN